MEAAAVVVVAVVVGLALLLTDDEPTGTLRTQQGSGRDRPRSTPHQAVNERIFTRVMGRELQPATMPTTMGNIVTHIPRRTVLTHRRTVHTHRQRATTTAHSRGLASKSRRPRAPGDTHGQTRIGRRASRRTRAHLRRATGAGSRVTPHCADCTHSARILVNGGLQTQ